MWRTVAGGTLLFALGACFAWWIAADPGGTAPKAEVGHAEEWTCGMHPTVVRDGPGACPICGMDLVPRRQSGSGGHDRVLHIDARTRQAIGVQTSRVERGPLSRELRLPAKVVPDERREVIVTSKYAGWIERVFVNESGRKVKKGEPLMSVYSPEVFAGQEELLLARRQGNGALIRSAKERLRLWDISESQLKRIVSSGRPRRAVIRYAPAHGHVLKKSIVPGQYIAAGEPLYQIVDLSRVWVEAEVYEYEVPWLALGNTATLHLAYLPGRAFAGRVAFIYPEVDEMSRTVRARLEFDNPELVMRPGMFGTARLEARHTKEVVHIPDTAVLRTGRRDITFVARGNGHFEPREIVIGRGADGGRVEVMAGLSEGERVVTRGQFLLDSESRLREALSKMRQGSLTASSMPSSAPASMPASRPASMPASRPALSPASRSVDGAK